ncbi:MAG: aminotransferase class I/II-fold pyridoxal phosphate-dependent enzyme [Anaerolineae bacterium]|nr:aminotransferase class I/II-fold pyridoxal phosphate-dependent enzyme [Anaerolineae bacterium]
MSDQSLEFGKEVKSKAEALAAEGRDANQVAKIIIDADPESCNYGIGIVLDNEGQAMATSETLLRYLQEEIEGSGRGQYRNSASLMADLKAAVLQWQRIPQTIWDSFVLALPSDAGTGAVSTAATIALAMHSGLDCIGVEELSWPGYKAIAKSCRVDYKEFPSEQAINREEVLPIYQASPQNTTGQVADKAVIAERAAMAANGHRTIILDRAYSGFEYASLLGTKGYDAIMGMSYERYIAPFVNENVPMIIAISPTKCFRSFALRPAGMLLAFIPDSTTRKQVTSLMNSVIRARGSAFEHPATRALVRAMIADREQLEREHALALSRLAETEQIWLTLSRGTAVEPLFAEGYAGLFRNPKIREGADVNLYNEHIYPVISSGRCRINITGIPSDENLQRKHAEAFARSCYL